MMKGQDSARIKNVIEDQAGNMVIAITKYRWTESLLHSGYGIVVVLGIVATVVLADGTMDMVSIASVGECVLLG